MGTSRTGYAAKNIGTNLFLYLATYIAVFISRTYFVRILGNDYLSITGLFQNVITIVSFAELGLGSASIYCLYKPISENNKTKIISLLNYFNKLYTRVIFISLAIGLLLLPGIPFIVDIPSLGINSSSVYYYYILFVINTSISYAMIEYKLFLIADQKQYKVNIWTQVIQIVILSLQTIYIYITKDYAGYLYLLIVGTVLTNFAIKWYVRKNYKDIFQQTPELLPVTERRSIIQNIKSIFYYKVGSVILNGADNVIISAFIKTTLVGLCSNYLLVVNSINSVLMQCFNGIGASIGNHIVESDSDKQLTVFNQLNLLCVFLFSFSSICIVGFINPFIRIWLGIEYVLDIWSVISIITVFYITGVNQVLSLYRTSFGLFKNARFYPIIAAISNIILAIIAAKLFGLPGVFFTTAFIKLIFFTLVDIKLVFHYGFKVHMKPFILKYFRDFIFVISGGILISMVLNHIDIRNFCQLIGYTIIGSLLTLIYLMLLYWKTESFKMLSKRISIVLQNKLNKR